MMKLKDLIDAAANDDNAALLLVARLKLRISVSEGYAWADPLCAALSPNPVPVGEDESAALRTAIVEAAKWAMEHKTHNAEITGG